MSDKPPSKLWYATLDFRQPGKWTPSETFYLNKPYYPEVIVPTKCHVLYESPLEALVGLHKEIMEVLKKRNPFDLQIFIYTVKPTLLNRGSYFSPEKLMEKEIFVYDRDLLKRHLIRQSCLFTRAMNVSISYNQFNKEPMYDLSFVDMGGKKNFLMKLRKPTVTMTFGTLSKFTSLAVEKALMNFDDFPFKGPILLTPHNKENTNASKCSMGSSGRTEAVQP